jgi:hypothetical protein
MFLNVGLGDQTESDQAGAVLGPLFTGFGRSPGYVGWWGGGLLLTVRPGTKVLCRQVPRWTLPARCLHVARSLVETESSLGGWMGEGYSEDQSGG